MRKLSETEKLTIATQAIGQLTDDVQVLKQRWEEMQNSIKKIEKAIDLFNNNAIKQFKKNRNNL